MTTGTSTAGNDEASLDDEVFAILLRFHREQGLKCLRIDLHTDDLKADAQRLSVELGAAIGGRYVPKRTMQAEARALRDAEIVAMWNGRNRAEVMKRFGISRRLFYTVISADLKRKSKAPAYEPPR